MENTSNAIDHMEHMRDEDASHYLVESVKTSFKLLHEHNYKKEE